MGDERLDRCWAGGQKKEGKGQEEVQRWIRESDGKIKRIEKGAITPPHTLEGGCVISPRWAAGAPGATPWLPRRGPIAVGGRPSVCGWAGGRSVVELALARLVDKAALVLGPTRMALAGAVLPLHHLGAQCVALRPLPSPLQPPHLARPLQQRSPRRGRGGCMVRGAELAADWRQLPAGTEQGQVRAGPSGAKASLDSSHRVPAPSRWRGAVSAHKGAPATRLTWAYLQGSSP